MSEAFDTVDFGILLVPVDEMSVFVGRPLLYSI